MGHDLEIPRRGFGLVVINRVGYCSGVVPFSFPVVVRGVAVLTRDVAGAEVVVVNEVDGVLVEAVSGELVDLVSLVVWVPVE